SIPIIERVERKTLIIGSALVMAASGLVFGYARETALIVAGGFVLTCASNVFSNAFHSYQAEIFPTGIRSSAISIAYSLSRATSADRLRLHGGTVVELPAGSEDLPGVFQGPVRDRAGQPSGLDPERCQAVLHSRRNGRVDGAADQPVAFQGAERLGQHLLRDA